LICAILFDFVKPEENVPLGSHISFTKLSLEQTKHLLVPLEPNQVSTVSDGSYGIYLVFEAENSELEFLVGGKPHDSAHVKDLEAIESGIAYPHQPVVVIITKNSPLWQDFTASKKIHVKVWSKANITTGLPSVKFAPVHSPYLGLEPQKHYLLKVHKSRALELRVDMMQASKSIDSRLNID
jgi:hypothetical protein